MPARGDRGAPQFNPDKPRELRRYFADLEFHFTRSAITDEAEKKGHATRLLDIDSAELWESLPSYTDVAIDYNGFKAAVYKLYPGSEEDRKWMIADMDKLIGERSRIGVLSLADLGDYH